MSLLIELFITFAKIALFTFGVGYAMLSLIENKYVEQKKWLTGASRPSVKFGSVDFLKIDTGSFFNLERKNEEIHKKSGYGEAQGNNADCLLAEQMH